MVMSMQKSDRIQRKWQPHTVLHDRGDARVDMSASQQILMPSQAWGHSFIYLPDKNRLMMQTGDVQLYSDDLGATWTKMSCSPPRRFFTYLGDGKTAIHGRRSSSSTCTVATMQAPYSCRTTIW